MKMKPTLYSILTSTAYLGAARILSAASRIVYAILLAKILEPETYGIFQYAYSWYLMFIPLSILGLNFVMIRELNKPNIDFNQYLTLTFSIRNWLSLLVAIISFLLGWIFESDISLLLLIGIFSLSIMGRGLSSWVTATLTGIQQSKQIFKLETFFRTLEVLVGIGLLLITSDIVYLAIWHCLTWFLQGMYGLSILRKNDLFVVLRKVSIYELLRTLKGCIPVFVAAICIMWFLQGPIILYRYMIGLGQELGYFALAMQAFIILGSVIAEFGNAALPMLTRQFSQHKTTPTSFGISVVVFGALLACILSFIAHSIGQWAVTLVIGNQYMEVAQLLPYSMLLIGPYFWLISFRSLFVSQEKYFHLIGSNLCGIAIFTLCALWLTPRLGAVGTIASAALGMFVSGIWQWVAIDKKGRQTSAC